MMQVKMNKFVQLSDISDYRQLLMGIGIIGVLFSHWFGFQSIEQGVPYMISDFIWDMVSVAGFLFLSGFGLYYSFSQNDDLIRFYKKRMGRVFAPFLLLSIPLYSYYLYVLDEYNWTTYIKQLSTMFFWTDGNYGGMWYISITLFLYVIFPCCYNFIFISQSFNSKRIRMIVLMLLLYIIIFFLQFFCIDYYKMIAIGIDKIVFFFLGMFWGYVVRNKVINSKSYFYLLLVIVFFYIIVTVVRIVAQIDGYIVTMLSLVLQKIAYMPIICIFFNIAKNKWLVGLLSKVLNWFGKYSLELYILHLHIYMFFRYSFLNEKLPCLYLASLSIVFALLLCAPVNRIISLMKQSMLIK